MALRGATEFHSELVHFLFSRCLAMGRMSVTRLLIVSFSPTDSVSIRWEIMPNHALHVTTVAGDVVQAGLRPEHRP